jgi:hypothetical protein
MLDKNKILSMSWLLLDNMLSVFQGVAKFIGRGYSAGTGTQT